MLYFRKYAFRVALQSSAIRFLLADGGQVVGVSKAPIATSDYSTYLLATQNTDAQVVALANGGDDTDNAIKQAAEYGLTAQGLKLAALSMYINNVAGLGLPESKGLYMSELFYWDLDDSTRAWSQRYFDRVKCHAEHASGRHLRRHHALPQGCGGSWQRRWPKAAAAMPAARSTIFYTKDATIQPNGRVIRPMYLLQVKAPAESHGSWDLMKVIATISGDQAFWPPDPACPASH